MIILVDVESVLPYFYHSSKKMLLPAFLPGEKFEKYDTYLMQYKK